MIKEKVSRTCLAFLVFIFTICALSADARQWESAFANPALSSVDLSDESAWYAFNPGADGKRTLSGIVTRMIARPEGGWTYIAKLQNGTMQTLVFDKSLKVLSEDMTLTDPDTIKKNGIDSLKYVSASGGKGTFTASLNGKTVKEESVTIGQNETLAEAISIQVQALVIAGETGLFNLRMLGLGQRMDIELNIRAEKDPLSLSKDYAFPSEMRTRLAPSAQPYIVAEFYLTGFFEKIVYPFHFFCVFDQSPKRKTIANWGGKPADSNLQWTRD